MINAPSKTNLRLKDVDTDDESDTEFNNTTDDIIGAGELAFNPYNPLNKEILVNNVQEIFNTYLPRVDSNIIKPNNMELYMRAFVHRSYTKKSKAENELANINIGDNPNDCLPLKTKSNERMEFIGDGVLELAIKYYLYRRFPKADEGFMTEKKIALVKNEHIGKLAYEMGLHKYYIISRHAEEKNVRTNLKKLGCLFEAFIGAIFLDFNRITIKDEDGWFDNVFATGPGFQMAQIFIENVMEKHVDWTLLIANDDNYKNQLQVIIQKEFKLTPEYVELHNINEPYNDNTRTYTMGLYICFGQNIHKANIDDAISLKDFKSFKEIHTMVEHTPKLLIFITIASHKIKKKAEQLACEYAIKLIKELYSI
jgi:dsRNA-specific ribonuclease